MEKPPLAVFTKEFKEEAVKMVMEEGLSIGELSRRLSIPKSTLDYCKMGSVPIFPPIFPQESVSPLHTASSRVILKSGQCSVRI